MRKLLLAGVVLAGFAVTGASCGDGSKIPPAEGLRLACDAFASELTILAPMRANGVLSASAVKIVDTQKAAVDPLCLGEEPDINASVSKVSVDAAVQVLTALAAEFVK